MAEQPESRGLLVRSKYFRTVTGSHLRWKPGAVLTAPFSPHRGREWRSLWPHSSRSLGSLQHSLPYQDWTRASRAAGGWAASKLEAIAGKMVGVRDLSPHSSFPKRCLRASTRAQMFQICETRGHTWDLCCNFFRINLWSWYWNGLKFM